MFTRWCAAVFSVRDECQLLCDCGLFADCVLSLSTIQRNCLLIALRFIAPVIASVTDNAYIKAYSHVNIIGREGKLWRSFVIIRGMLHAVRNYISVIALAGFITRCSSYANRFGKLLGLRIIKYVIRHEWIIR